MTTSELKANLHHLIDEIENPDLLEEYYNEIKYIINASKHNIWDTLNDEQRKEVLLSYEESEDDKNLIDSDKVMEKYKKWL